MSQHTPPPTALLFAGQGTQYPGMGRALYDRFPEARAVFDTADAALGFPLTRLIFEGPEEALAMTEHTQPAVLTVACAGLAILTQRGFAPAAVAGHSLGEFGALVAAGALEFEAAVRLCRMRGRAMQAATPPGLGAMAAVMRADPEAVQAACEAAAKDHGPCSVAADNAPGLLVITGREAAVKAAGEALSAQRAQVRPLQVSAPFHSPLLGAAAEALAKALEVTDFEPLQIPYVDNVGARWTPQASAAEIRERLVAQVTAPVQWRRSLQTLLDQGIERFWHLGPGRSNLSHIKRLARKAPMGSLDTAADLEQILGGLTSAGEAS